MKYFVIEKSKRIWGLILVGICCLIMLPLAAAYWWYIAVPYRASQFILVTSDEYEWPEDHIFAVLPDGSHMTELTRGSGPSCSPDGRRIAFISVDKPDEHFYANPAYVSVMNSDGTNIRVLASEAGGGPLSWSPDSNKLAFQNGYGLSILDVKSFAVSHVWASAAPQPSDVTWSSVDDQLVFEAYRLKPDGSEDTENEGFHISNLDGTNLRRLTSGDDWRPDWSPNGQEILYEHYEDTTPYLRVIGADGRNQHDVPLPPEVQVFFAPKWSADGTHIIFSGQRELFGAEHAIYSVKPDGSDFHPILVAGETLGKDIGENFPLPRDVMFSDVDWCEVR